MSLRAPHAHEGITIPTLMFKVTLALLPMASRLAPPLSKLLASMAQIQPNPSKTISHRCATH